MSYVESEAYTTDNNKQLTVTMTLEDTISKRNTVESNGTLWFSIKGVKGQGGNQGCFSVVEVTVSDLWVCAIRVQCKVSLTRHRKDQGRQAHLRRVEKGGKIMVAMVAMLACCALTYVPI
jgi:hypothetical protein